jgi:hypothetical protein
VAAERGVEFDLTPLPTIEAVLRGIETIVFEACRSRCRGCRDPGPDRPQACHGMTYRVLTA